MNSDKNHVFASLVTGICVIFCIIAITFMFKGKNIGETSKRSYRNSSEEARRESASNQEPSSINPASNDNSSSRDTETNNTMQTYTTQSTAPDSQITHQKQDQPIQTQVQEPTPHTNPQEPVINTEPTVESCYYRERYGDASPSDLANASPTVIWYKQQYDEAYQEYVFREKYKNESDWARQQFSAASFAKEKAYKLWQDEYNYELNHYQELLDNCK